MKFSACWIAKNEEKNILRSIESLKEVVDELVVIDTGSSDDTVQIAESAGARIGFFEWNGDFSAARNYALSQTTGDIVFFLDADEWFSPALASPARDIIERTFANNANLDAIQMTIRNLNNQGAVKTTSVVNRIYRLKGGGHFIKNVHERYVRENGDPPVVSIWPDVYIDHCGYVEDIMSVKMARNIELLELAAEGSDNPEESHLQHCYLVREYFQIDDFENSSRHLKKVLENPDMLRRHCVRFGIGFAQILYHMLLMPSENKGRKSASRAELYRKVVETFKKNMRGYPGTASIELFHSALFDIKDDILLSQITPVMEAAAKIPETNVSYYHESESIIYQRASSAALRRGLLTDAMDYAVASFKNTQSKNPASLHILLSCMRGIGAGDIIVFLNSQFDLSDAGKLEYLSNGTRIHGFRDVHAYYLDKRIKAGLATKEDYLYLLLLYGHYEQSVRAARDLYNDGVAGVVAKAIFMAAVCMDEKRIYLDNAEYLKGYEHVLDSYFSREPLDHTTGVDCDILLQCYEPIALAAGFECADRLKNLYVSQPLLQFQTKSLYCVNNGLYDELLAEDMPMHDDLLSNRSVVNCLMMAGRCEEAYTLILRNFDEGRVDGVFLQYLSAVAYRSTGWLNKSADNLYQRYIVAYDSYIDTEDMVNTGYVADETNNKRKIKTCKSLTASQFQKQLAEEETRPHITGFVELCEKAGAMLEEKGLPAAAMEYYRYLYAISHNKDENREKLISLFESVGNNQVADWLRKQV